MTDVGDASPSRGVVSGLLARSRRPAIAPGGGMLFAEAVPSVDEPAPRTMAAPVAVAPAEPAHAPVPADAGRSEAGKGRSVTTPAGAGTSETRAVRPPAPLATVDIEPTATPIPVPPRAPEAAEPEREPTLTRALTPEPAQPEQHVIVPALLSVDAAPVPAHAAVESLQTGPTATLTERAIRGPSGAPVPAVLSDPPEPDAPPAPTRNPRPATDGDPAHIVGATHPASVADPTPPVTIGEIHVHVAGPTEAPADPLALLAPWANGLTARRAATA